MRRIIKKHCVTGTEVFETCPKCQSWTGLPTTATPLFLVNLCIVLFDSVYDYRIGEE